ncbi:MAG TPA: branched-chain amino acid ABC transporter permease [Castellaniella sp.]|uniref:branched-chain amino acid ABC transporter permease n=1 Tax=Castellaniella sp. TaxID=1955812 RepID=UPI002F158984
MTAASDLIHHCKFWAVPLILVIGSIVIFGLSFMFPPEWLFFLQNVLVLGLFAVSTNLLVGYGGLVSFGQAVFYGLGAYVVALGWLHLHWPFWVLFILSPIVGALSALVIGALVLRTKTWYFALLTLAFSQLFFTIANQWYGFTRGANGVFGSMIPMGLLDPQVGLWFVLIICLVALLLLWMITVSPFGLTLQALRENSKRLEALGVNLYRYQLYAFVLSGAFCALAGALFVVRSQSAYPELLEWTQSGEPILVSVIGGLHYFLGPLVGALIFVFTHDYLVAHSNAWELILGLTLLLIVLFAPNGLLGVGQGAGRAGGVRALLSSLLPKKRHS